MAALVLGAENWAALAPKLLWPLWGAGWVRPRLPTTTVGAASASIAGAASELI